MNDIIENPNEEGCYIVDRRSQSIEDSVNQLTDFMVSFCQKTRRQRINQRNRVERLSPLLDWKNLGVEYAKARQLSLRRAYPDLFEDANWDMNSDIEKLAYSVPNSPRYRGGTMTPGDIGTLTEEMQHLATTDYNGTQSWHDIRQLNDEDEYPQPLHTKVRSRGMSGSSTPGNGIPLTERDLARADQALKTLKPGQNGH